MEQEPATTRPRIDPARVAESAGPVDLGANRCWFALDRDGAVSGTPAGLDLATRQGWSDPAGAFHRAVFPLAERLRAGSVRLDRRRLSGPRGGAAVTLALMSLRIGRETVLVVVADPAGAAGVSPPAPPAKPTSGAQPVPTAPERAEADTPRSRLLWRTDGAGRLHGLDHTARAVLGAQEGDRLAEGGDEAAALLRTAHPFTATSISWRRPSDGTMLALSLSGTPVRLEDGTIGYKGFALYDPTEPGLAPGTSESAADDPDYEPQMSPAAGRETRQDTLGTRPVSPPMLSPIFNAIVDVSLTGWSQLMNVLPAPPSDPGSTAATAAAAEPAAAASGRMGEAVRATATIPERGVSSLPDAPGLSPTEQGALSEIARVLGARIEGEPAPEPAPTADRESATVLPLVPPRLRDGEMRAALDGSPTGAVVHGRDRILFANRAFLALTGPADLAMLRAAPWAGDLLRQDGGGGKPARLLLPSGTVELVSAPIEWGGRSACLTLAWAAGIDPEAMERGFATELAQRDARLADLQTALRTVDEGIVTIDAGGRITALSGAAQGLFGYGENEIAGEQVPVLFAPESRSDAFALVERARLGRALDGERVQARGRRRDGSAVDLELSARPLDGAEDGTVLLAIADATRQRAMEHTLGVVHRDLEAAHRQSGDLLNRVGHEIRSPLTAIIGFADLLLEERLGPLADDRVRPYLEGIRSSGLDVIGRLDEFRRYADALTGRIDTAPASTDLNALLSETVTALGAMSVRDRVVLRTSLAPGLPPAWLDPSSVRQAINHLLTAAIALTPPGGQVITATALAGRELAWSVRAKDARLSPQDIDAALRPFAERPGTLVLPRGGFALAFAKALVEANGAELTVTSGAGDGPLFEVRFPLAAGEPPAPLRLASAG